MNSGTGSWNNQLNITNHSQYMYDTLIVGKLEDTFDIKTFNITQAIPRWKPWGKDIDKYATLYVY